MYAIAEITGTVGGVHAPASGRTAGQGSCARGADKGRPWVEKGCEVAIASIADADGLTKAFCA